MFGADVEGSIEFFNEKGLLRLRNSVEYCLTGMNHQGHLPVQLDLARVNKTVGLNLLDQPIKPIKNPYCWALAPKWLRKPAEGVGKTRGRSTQKS
jgi:hypothetical protein